MKIENYLRIIYIIFLTVTQSISSEIDKDKLFETSKKQVKDLWRETKIGNNFHQSQRPDTSYLSLQVFTSIQKKAENSGKLKSLTYDRLRINKERCENEEKCELYPSFAKKKNVPYVFNPLNESLTEQIFIMKVYIFSHSTFYNFHVDVNYPGLGILPDNKGISSCVLYKGFLNGSIQNIAFDFAFPKTLIYPAYKTQIFPESISIKLWEPGKDFIEEPFTLDGLFGLIGQDPKETIDLANKSIKISYQKLKDLWEEKNSSVMISIDTNTRKILISEDFNYNM